MGLTTLLILFLLIFSPPVFGEADSLLLQLFPLDSREEAFNHLFFYLSQIYPEMEQITFQEGRLQKFQGDLYFYTMDYYLYLALLPIGPYEDHLFLHFQGKENVELVTILALDPPLTPLPFSHPLPLNENLTVRTLSLDEKTKGIGIRSSIDELYGIYGDYFLYSYSTEMGYEWIRTFPNSSVEELETLPLEILVIEYLDWDDSFPFHNLSGYCQICQGLFSRTMGTSFYWYPQEETLLEGEKKEILKAIGVVNHYLKALKEGDYERAFSFLAQELLEKIEDIHLPFITQSDLFFFPDIYDWAIQVNYKEEVPLISILVSGNNERGLNLQEDEIIYVILFAFDDSNPFLINDIYLHQFDYEGG